MVFSQDCVYPGQTPPETCQPPQAINSVVVDIPGRRQWGDRNGYCGSNSVQMIALHYGAWISQDLIRKSVGNNELIQTNIGPAITTLLFNLDSWSYSAYPIPQWSPYLTWMKQHLIAAHPVIWFVYCQGDSHHNNPTGYYDHIEPIFGIYSNKTLDPSGTWYPDDQLVHNSCYDQNHYYRPFSSLQDDMKMKGNCAVAPSGVGHNEMYPCIPSDNYDYGFAMTGFVDPKNIAVPAQLYVSDWQEPDLDKNVSAENMTGTLHVSGLKSGSNYTIYRWDDKNQCPGCLGGTFKPSIPSNSDYANSNYTYKNVFTAASSTYIWVDPIPFLSSGASYYRVIPS